MCSEGTPKGSGGAPEHKITRGFWGTPGDHKDMYGWDQARPKDRRRNEKGNTGGGNPWGRGTRRGWFYRRHRLA